MTQGTAPSISDKAQAAIDAQQRVFSQELALELQLRNAALHEAVEVAGYVAFDGETKDAYIKVVTETAAAFLEFLKTGESK